MQLHNGNSLPVKPLATATADVAALLAHVNRVNGNGQAGAAEPAVTLVYESRRTGSGTTTKPRRATGPQMKGGENLAAKRAEAGLLLQDALHLKASEAAASTGSSVPYLRAMRTIQQSGDFAMLNAARTGAIAPGPAAGAVKHLAAMRVAFAAASPAELVTFFKDVAVTDVALKAVSAEELLRAAITAFGGVDETLNALAAMSEMKAMVAQTATGPDCANAVSAPFYQGADLD